MNKTAYAAVLLAGAAAAGEASADWSGVYFGINGGYAQSSAGSAAQMGGSGYFGGANLASINANGATTLDYDGVTAGAQIGFNMHLSPSVVFGIEGDVNYMDASQAKSLTVVYPASAPSAYTLSAQVDQEILATIRARLGFEIGPKGLLYVTGGYAYSDADYTISFRDNFPGGVPTAIPLSSGSGASGWVLGAGGEWMVGSRTSLKIEYLYADLGTLDASGSIGGAAPSRIYSGQLDLTEQSVRVGFNIRL